MLGAVLKEPLEMDNDTVAELEKINKDESDKGIAEIKHEFLQENHKTPFRRQTLISLGVFMLTLSAGATSGISAVMIPQMELSRGSISTEMISWVAAISSFALFFGNLISGYLMERFGRRLSLLLLSVGFVIGWLIIGFSYDILSLILLGRFTTGLCQGWLGPLGPVFVGEITSPVHRGFLLASLSLAIAVGIFLAHLFGTILHWTTAAILCGMFPLIGGVITYYASESPTWLASRNKIDESIQSFLWYRGTSPEMKTELDRMLTDLNGKISKRSKMQVLAANIKKPEFYKPLLIMTIFFIICQLTGVNVVCAYTTVMMKELMTTTSSSSYTYVAMLSIDVLRCVSLGVACVLLRTVGRRPVALLSGAFTSLSLILLALYLYLSKSGGIEYMNSYISLSLMAFYIIVSNMGVCPLPWNMVGELFAVETKGIGSGISVMMTSITFFGVVKTAPSMFISIGHHGTYLFYGLSTLCGTIFLFFCLPETKDKTLLEIEEYFRYGKKKDRNVFPEDL